MHITLVVAAASGVYIDGGNCQVPTFKALVLEIRAVFIGQPQWGLDYDEVLRILNNELTAAIQITGEDVTFR